jgi:hypothetical protein
MLTEEDGHAGDIFLVYTNIQIQTSHHHPKIKDPANWQWLMSTAILL